MCVVHRVLSTCAHFIATADTLRTKDRIAAVKVTIHEMYILNSCCLRTKQYICGNFTIFIILCAMCNNV